MSVTSGFFNSVSGDRRYNSEQISALFDGLINDGVFANIGTAFGVNANGANEITVGIGRAWLKRSWIYNDSILPLSASASDVLLDRYDAVVIEIDTSESVRAGSIKIVEGTPASSPAKPTMIDTPTQHQRPLCYIYRKAGSTEITQADITNTVGTSSLPYVTGILEVQSIDKIVAQWEAQWNQWFTDEITEFDTWFATMKGLLDEEVATKLANRLLALENGTTPAAKATADANGNNIGETYARKSEIVPLPSTMPPSPHNQSAETITAGTFAGKVVANANAVGTLGDKQVRNIYAGTSDMTPGTTALPTGDIYVMYE